MTDALYLDSILEAARQPQHQGELVAPSITVSGRNASCGDELTLDLLWDAAGKVTAIKWRGTGCIISQAAAETLAEYILTQHLTLDQIRQITIQDLSAQLGLTQLAPGRVKCLQLALSVIVNA